MHGYGYPPQQPPRRRPADATLVWLRVLFVTLAVMSCGFLGWAAMLRLAIVTRRSRDWVAFAAVLALDVGLFAFFIVVTPEAPNAEISDRDAVIGFGWMLAVLGGVIGYYLYQEIRHYGPKGPVDARGSMSGQPGPHGSYGSYGSSAQPPYAGHTAGRSPYDAPGPTGAAPGYGYPPAAARPTSLPGTMPPVPASLPDTAPSGPVPPPSAAPVPAATRPPMPDRPAPLTPLAPSEPVRPTPLAPPQRIDQVRAELDELSDYLRKDGDSR